MTILPLYKKHFYYDTGTSRVAIPIIYISVYVISARKYQNENSIARSLTVIFPLKFNKIEKKNKIAVVSLGEESHDVQLRRATNVQLKRPHCSNTESSMFNWRGHHQCFVEEAPCLLRKGPRSFSSHFIFFLQPNPSAAHARFLLYL